MDKKLSRFAYGGIAGKNYTPYTSADSSSMSLPVIIAGILLAALFAASTAYSGMKAGMTVAAGIPGAIIGSAIVAAFARQKGILGRNLLQGASSGGESVASGMIFVLPAVLLIGSQVGFVESLVTGIAGVLFGIGAANIIYNYLIVEEHGNLLYPESMAISETLVAAEGVNSSLKSMGVGFGIGGIITIFSGSFMNVVNTVISYSSKTFYKWNFELEVNPMLLGIGFIVGLDVSLTMFAGSILANFGILPLINYFSSLAIDNAVVWNNPSIHINLMSISNISGSYVRYIGAGMMLSGGFIGAIKLIPTIVSSLKSTFGFKNSPKSSELGNIIIFVGVIIAFVAAFIISHGSILMAITSALLSLLLALLFVIVAGRLAGTVGCSSLPVSGMTIASIVLVTALFSVNSWSDMQNNKSLLLFGTFIVTAIATGAGYAQTQKASFIIGGDKNEMLKFFLLAAVIGVVIVVSVIMLLSGQLAMTGDKVPFALPQANLISTLTQGIMSGVLPWDMVIVGFVMGVVVYLLKLPVMTVAIGFYLPIATTSIFLIGSLLRVAIEKASHNEVEKEEKISAGISLSSGLVAGGSIIGLIGIICQVTGIINLTKPVDFFATNAMAICILILLLIAVFVPLVLVKNGSKSTSSQ